MKNNTPSKIIIEMKHIDHARRLAEALQRWANMAGTGGDAELYIRKGRGNEFILCRIVGHDVEVKKVTHVIKEPTK